MERFARIVVGYHGCSRAFAEDLLLGKQTIDDWKPSKNEWDWLGEGIYFWEHAPERARRWAQNNMARRKTKTGAAEPDVVGAMIQLGNCFDLTDIEYTSVLSDVHKQVREEYAEKGWELPDNKPLPKSRSDKDLKMRHLDCLIINETIARATKAPQPVSFDTVRGAFWEGEEAYPGAMILKESHIQISVRNPNCILGVFRPKL